MIKEYCDRCGKEIKKGRKKNISFDCADYVLVPGISGKIDMTVCLKCQHEIKEFATRTIPYKGKWRAKIVKE